jgi:hypothetical protein
MQMLTELNGRESAQNLLPVFVCYRQTDGKDVAERLVALLSSPTVSVVGSCGAAEDPPQLDIYFDQTAPGVGDWTMVHEPYLKRARAFIVVCTPGAKLDEGDGDWVQREITWWIQNRDEWPILIDALGTGERYVPKIIADKWPNAQRINIILKVWDQLSHDELDAVERRTRERILGGITSSAGNLYRRELAREQERTRELSEALSAQKRLSHSLKRSFLAISVLFLLAAGIAVDASWQRHVAESQALSAQAEETLSRDQPAALELAIRGWQTAKTTESNLAVAHAFPQLLVALEGHTGSIVYAAFSPDGQWVVTASDDHTARVWNANNGRLLATLDHADSVTSAAFSPDGQRVVTSSDDHTARVWNASNGHLLATLDHRDSVTWAAFSHDGERIVTAGDETRVWKTATGKLLTELKVQPAGVEYASFSPDDQRIVTADGFDDTARVWRATDGQLLFTLKGHTREV